MATSRRRVMTRETTLIEPTRTLRNKYRLEIMGEANCSTMNEATKNGSLEAATGRGLCGGVKVRYGNITKEIEGGGEAWQADGLGLAFLLFLRMRGEQTRQGCLHIFVVF